MCNKFGYYRIIAYVSSIACYNNTTSIQHADVLHCPIESLCMLTCRLQCTRHNTMQAHAVHDTVGHPCDLNPKAKVVQRRLKRIQFRYAQFVGQHVQQSCNNCTVKTSHRSFACITACANDATLVCLLRLLLILQRSK
jgi:hypothetical protein